MKKGSVRESAILDKYDMKILSLTKKKEMNITQLSKELNLAYKNILHHINKLEDMGFIKKEKLISEEGKQMIIKPVMLPRDVISKLTGMTFGNILPTSDQMLLKALETKKTRKQLYNEVGHFYKSEKDFDSTLHFFLERELINADLFIISNDGKKALRKSLEERKGIGVEPKHIYEE